MASLYQPVSYSVSEVCHTCQPLAAVLNSWLHLYKRQLFINCNLSNFTNTVSSNQYRLLLCHGWKKSPHFLFKKIPQFCKLLSEESFVKILKCCYWKILSYVGLLVHYFSLCKNIVSPFDPEFMYIYSRVGEVTADYNWSLKMHMKTHSNAMLQL